MIVKLDKFELEMAAFVGKRRHEEAQRMGLKDKHGFVGDSITVHCQGAIGEIVVAKFLGVYWPGSVNTFENADIESCIQVRYRSNRNFDLIVRDEDSSTDFFALVVPEELPDKFNFVGWIEGCDAKDKAFLKTYGGRPAAYFVPQSKLNCPSILNDVIRDMVQI